MKKFFALLLALTMLFALAACGKTAPNRRRPARKDLCETFAQLSPGAEIDIPSLID